MHIINFRCTDKVPALSTSFNMNTFFSQYFLSKNIFTTIIFYYLQRDVSKSFVTLQFVFPIIGHFVMILFSLVFYFVNYFAYPEETPCTWRSYPDVCDTFRQELCEGSDDDETSKPREVGLRSTDLGPNTQRTSDEFRIFKANMIQVRKV